MENSMIYGSTGSVHDSTSECMALRPAISGANNFTVSNTHATDLNSRELQIRLDLIRGLYKSETSQDGRKQYRNEARRIKQAIGKNRRMVVFTTGSFVVAIAFLIIFLQNYGLLL